MSELINERVSFGHGFVQGRDKVRVIARFDDMAEQGSAASSLMMWAGEGRGWRNFDLAWMAIRVACSKTAMFALSADGRVMIADARGVREERIAGSEGRGGLSDLCLFEYQPLAVGAAGQVYRRAGEGEWIELSDGLPAGDDAPGLRAVDCEGGEVCAVGDGGQIWRLSGETWNRLASPIDAALNAVRMIGPGKAVAVGDGGNVILVDGDAAGSAAERAPADLLAVERFGGRTYVAAEHGLYRLLDGGRIDKVHVFDGPSWTYRHLHAGDGMLWSFGREHLIGTADGEEWTLLRSPFQSIDPTECGPGGGGGSCGCGHDHHH